jgi:2-oxoisovalerate dehydrogenase E2 component (dihydrolipoyl transacylase)
VRLRDAATNGKLSMADITGTTISLSNVGNIGGSWLHPVIVSGQVAIGAIGAIKRVPRFVMRDGKETVEPVLEVAVSFSADHRVIDGATMARFVNLWKGYVEDPASMQSRL